MRCSNSIDTTHNLTPKKNVDLGLADNHKTRKQSSRVKQIKLLNISIQTNFTGQRIKPIQPAHLLHILHRPMNPPGDHPTHDQRLPLRRPITTVHFDRLKRPPASRRRENPYPVIHLPFHREPVSYYPANAALLRRAKARAPVYP